MRIGGLTAKEFNHLANVAAHTGLGWSCPRCAESSRDFRTVKMWGEVWYGACKKCSDEQSEALRRYMTCEDLINPVVQKGDEWK